MTNLFRLRHLTFILLAAIALPGFANLLPTRQAAVPAYDLVITNARVVDGTGNPWFRADIGIKNGRIARIGRLMATDAARAIDARRQIVAPGFIDVHTHVESIYEQPEAENFVRMGVTSLVTGNCGNSATDIAQFLGKIKEQPLTVNLATLVAHGSVRKEVLGLENRAPSPEELRRMEAMLNRR
ncbi:MAG TPA: hypothetical protein VF658_17865 [Pyrinomonadaceae bacterium]|jgi:N-acyl-D-amino-acid deacylase